jgi:TolB protein
MDILSKLLIILLVLGLFWRAPTRAQETPTGDVGQIGLTGADGNLYIYDMATGGTQALTKEAPLTPPERFYQWVTWSSDGRLAYFGASFDPADPFRLGVFVQDSPSAPAKRVYASVNEVFTYAHWAPAPCPEGDCRDLALLYTGARGLAVRLIRVGAAVKVREVSQGGPHYWDWSPDASAMFWARFGTDLEIFDVAEGVISQTFPEQRGFGQSVDWSPTDTRLLAGVLSADGSTQVVIIDGNDRETLARGLLGAAYAWSPTAEQVALLNYEGGQLSLIDVASKQVFAQPAEDVVAFFWSPDASKLAYLTLNEGPEAGGAKLRRQSLPRLTWQLYDLMQGRNLRLGSFTPSQEMIYYLNFFDQFAHSHALWSPDSRYIVYGEQNIDGTTAVRLLDVTQAGKAPRTVSNGTMGVFSWR